MIRYEQTGLSVPNSELGTLQVTPEGYALGAIPGWAMLVDPSYKAPTGNGYRNRALPRNFLLAPQAYEDRQFDNGAPAFSSNGFNSASMASSDFALNPDEFSIFLVLKRRATNAGVVSYLVRPVTNPVEGETGLLIFATSSNAIALHDKIPAAPFNYRIPLNGAMGPLAGASDSVLCMFTFSTELGTAGYINGRKVFSNPDDKTPLSPSMFEAGRLRFYHQTSTDVPTGPVTYGMHGALSVDLSRKQHEADRYRIEEFLKTKYAIV